MRPGAECSRTSVLSKLTTMRLCMIGIFCLAAVQILAPAVAANKTAGAAVETTTASAGNVTLMVAVQTATANAVDNTRMAAVVANSTVAPTAGAAVVANSTVAPTAGAAVVANSTVAPTAGATVVANSTEAPTAGAAVETIAATAGNNSVKFAVNGTHAAAGNNTVKIAVNAAPSHNTGVAGGNNTVKFAVNNTRAAAGNNTVKVAVNNARVAAGNNTVKVAVNDARVAAGNNTVKVAVNNTRVAAGNKIGVSAGNDTHIAVGIKMRVAAVKKNVKVNVKRKENKGGPTTAATGNYTGAVVDTTPPSAATAVHANNYTVAASVETSPAAAGNYTGAPAGYTAAPFGVHERSFRRVRSIGDEPLNGAFAEKMKKWFKRLKNRIFGKKKNETTTPAPEDEAVPVVTLDKEDLLFIRRNPRRTNLNLTTLTLDPKRDWGFRLGKWLIIRKNSAWKKPEGRLTGTEPTPADNVSSEAPTTATPTRRIQRCPPYKHHTVSPTSFGPTVTAHSAVTDTPRSRNFEPSSPNPSRAPVTAHSAVTDTPRSTNVEPSSPNPSRAPVTAAPESTTFEEVPTSEAPVEGTSKAINTGEKRRDLSAEVIGPNE